MCWASAATPQPSVTLVMKFGLTSLPSRLARPIVLLKALAQWMWVRRPLSRPVRRRRFDQTVVYLFPPASTALPIVATAVIALDSAK